MSTTTMGDQDDSISSFELKEVDLKDDLKNPDNEDIPVPDLEKNLKADHIQSNSQGMLRFLLFFFSATLLQKMLNSLRKNYT